MSDSSDRPLRAITGRVRERRTGRGVAWADQVSRWLVTVGGIGTIAAVLAVSVFLVWVVVPLFRAAEVGPDHDLDDALATAPAALGADDHRLLAWALLAGGEIRVFRLDDGAELERRPALAASAVTASAVTASAVEGNSIALGLTDGRVVLGEIGFASRYLELDQAPAEAAGLAVGEVAAVGRGLAVRTPGDQIRIEELDVELGAPIATGGEDPIVRLDHVQATTGPLFVSLSSAGRLTLSSVRTQRNLLTGRTSSRVRTAELPFPPSARGLPDHVLVSGLGDAVYVAWGDGHLIRWDTRDRRHPAIAEEIDLVPEPGVRLTALRFLLGRYSLIAGDSSGRVRAWFRTASARGSGDAGDLTAVRDLLSGAGAGAITALAPSTRSRTVAIGDAGGRAFLVYVTSGACFAGMELAGGGRIDAIAIAPKDDGLLAASAGAVHVFAVDPRHPEATLSALFRPVWYEGYAAPAHVWQSSAASDDAEPKLGLMPLVFGTLKATVYSMLFAVPLALLGALYTSEFLAPSWKHAIKPTVELMASLPSVVLGFLAALVFAPFVERVVPSILVSILTVPLALIVGAYLWQMLPYRSWLRLGRWRLGFVALALPAGLALAAALGPLVERAMFAGEIKLWLDGQVGSGTGGWLLLLLPASALLTALLLSRVVGPWRRTLASGWSRDRCARMDLVESLVAGAFTLGICLAVARLLVAMGLDPRGSVLATYVQRNALVVGFVMGFAVIPIIYTIAEDALSSVPEHLRAASLGAGATRWQTAVRIVVPTAMSGLFSACMIGLGRAVGETMIVLMAAGNTPIMDWNVFNGFRTLSANIAVELPEAVVGSSHYRTLFLAALTLFAMTFLVNTVAEVIRLRFRRRAYQL